MTTSTDDVKPPSKKGINVEVAAEGNARGARGQRPTPMAQVKWKQRERTTHCPLGPSTALDHHRYASEPGISRLAPTGSPSVFDLDAAGRRNSTPDADWHAALDTSTRPDSMRPRAAPRAAPPPPHSSLCASHTLAQSALAYSVSTANSQRRILRLECNPRPAVDGMQAAHRPERFDRPAATPRTREREGRKAQQTSPPKQSTRPAGARPPIAEAKSKVKTRHATRTERIA
ncbi:hypothetical protein DFH09DRAFT_1508723 [Mycena vulgaris]|nr:hypothetical protein DFH09DRAFT_1508723 [Mycena vulgaris]